MDTITKLPITIKPDSSLQFLVHAERKSCKTMMTAWQLLLATCIKDRCLNSDSQVCIS